MPESVVEIVRVCIGFFLVIFGYIASIKERYVGMPLIGLKEQPTGIINGFADFNGKKTKVYAEMDIQAGEIVYVSDVEGNIIKVKKLK